MHTGRVLTGRNREAAELARAVAERRPVVVTGEAGAGKTTLLRTVTRESGRPVLEGGALATLSWMDYLPLTRALGREVTGADRDAVAADVNDAVGGDGLLLLDDLQWAAPATLDVIVALAGRVGPCAGVRTGTESADAVRTRLVDAGFVEIPLAPLDDTDAADLARAVRPGLGASEVAQVVRRSGGNPLLLRELAATGEASTSLRRTVGARLRDLTAEEREAFALVALAGRPLGAQHLTADATARLVAAGLLQRVPEDGVDVRHALFAEILAEGLDPGERQALHRRLAELVPDPGEAARHFDLAGDRAQSHACAVRAAAATTRPGERARHLRLAAMNASGGAATELRLAAAESLEAAYDWDGLFEVLDQIHGASPAQQARAALIRVRAAWGSARTDELRPALEAGLAAAAEAGTGDVATLLRIEACRVPIFVELDAEAGARQAREAVALAEANGVGRARAEYFLGTALALLDRREGAERLERAVAEARNDSDVGTELTAANNLVSFHEMSGSPDLAAALAHEMAARGRELGLGYWETNFDYQALQLDFHAGRYRGLVAAVAELVRRPLDVRTRDSLLEVQCMALVDTGRPDEAVRLAERSLLEAADPGAAVQFRWTLAEAYLGAGDPRRALDHAEAFLAELPHGNPNRAFGVVTRAWARFELGERPDDEVADHDKPILRAVPHETGALSAAHAGHLDRAIEGLREAADLWAPYHRRGELRCAWAAAELLRRSGDVDAAVAELTVVEKRAADIGLVAILHRCERSLRAAGQRRASTRDRGPGGITRREHEVLELVGQGLNNDQVAARLGTTRRTVVAQIASASAKLGAENRNQAAALAARLRDERR